MSARRADEAALEQMEMLIAQLACSVAENDSTRAVDSAAAAGEVLGAWVSDSGAIPEKSALPQLLALRASAGRVGRAADELSRLATASLLDFIRVVEDPGYADRTRLTHPARPLGVKQWRA